MSLSMRLPIFLWSSLISVSLPKAEYETSEGWPAVATLDERSRCLLPLGGGHGGPTPTKITLGVFLNLITIIFGAVSSNANKPDNSQRRRLVAPNAESS